MLENFRYSNLYTVRTGFILMSQKSLFLSTSCTQNCPEAKRLKFEKLKYLYLKFMFFFKVSQHVLIFETLLKSESTFTHFSDSILLKCDLRCAHF